MRNLKSTFKSDLNGEEVLGEFLDEFLYSKTNIINFTRNKKGDPYFIDKQYRGIDVSFNFNGIDYIVDEKATLSYPNGIPTFAFEIKYFKNGVWKNGWLFDENKETEYYLFAWPIRNNVPLSRLTVDDIKSVEVMLVNRNRILNYLSKSCFLDIAKAEQAAMDIIKANTFGKLHTIHPNSKHHYFFTEHLAEKPINIVIDKNTLKNLGEFYFNVDRSKPYSKSDCSQWLQERYR